MDAIMLVSGVVVLEAMGGKVVAAERESGRAAYKVVCWWII